MLLTSEKLLDIVLKDWLMQMRGRNFNACFPRPTLLLGKIREIIKNIF